MAISTFVMLSLSLGLWSKWKRLWGSIRKCNCRLENRNLLYNRRVKTPVFAVYVRRLRNRKSLAKIWLMHRIMDLIGIQGISATKSIWRCKSEGTWFNCKKSIRLQSLKTPNAALTSAPRSPIWKTRQSTAATTPSPFSPTSNVCRRATHLPTLMSSIWFRDLTAVTRCSSYQ